MEKHKAGYYNISEGKITCQLCPHNCKIAEGKTGICGVRSNYGGILYANSFGRITAIHDDPIEKKPLYHFYPGSMILSIGSFGCNLRCPFCQNWSISQDLNTSSSYYSPADIVEIAAKNGSPGIAYTYNEPMIWAEYAIETSLLARKQGIYNVMVTNGYVNDAPLRDLVQTIDAFNIDLKSFNSVIYKKIMKADLESVTSTIKTVYESNRHVEVTTLIVTGINDTIEEMDDIINFIADLDKNIPWHISRYYPNYKYSSDATDLDFIFNVYQRAKKSLNYVYCGNVPVSAEGSDTICPYCGSVVINRRGYHTVLTNFDQGKCGSCGRELNFII